MKEELGKKMINKPFSSIFMMLSVFLLSILVSAFMPQDSFAQSQPSLSQNVAVGVTEAIGLSTGDPTKNKEPDIPGAIRRLDKIISDRGDKLKGYDKATVYEIRGNLKIQLDDLPNGLRDLQTAIDTNALPPERSNIVRYLVAQVNFQLENYDQAIVGLRQWLASTQEAPSANAYYLLALAYIAKEDHRQAQQPMERALELKDGDPDKNYYNVLNLIYSENNEKAKRANLLERMINFWPEDSTLWAQLAGAYATDGKDNEAFSVLEVAYRAGLLTREEQIIQLIQYYSFFDNAFRGAQLLEREMAAGVVSDKQDNLILLSQLWDQSREPKKAIPILERAAANSQSGEIDFRLGRVFLADEQYQKAEQSIQRAINKGGLKRKDLASAWELLGNARFSQAGSDNVAQLSRAREAFQKAASYPQTRRASNRWVSYINELINVKRLQDEREKQEIEQLCNNTLERLEDARRTITLQGGNPDTDLSQSMKDDLTVCNFDSRGNIIGATTGQAEQSEGEEE